MGKKNEVMVSNKKSAGSKIFKAIVFLGMVNGALKLYSMYKENKENATAKNEGNEVKVYKVFMNGRQIKLDGEKVEGIFLKAYQSGINLDLRNAIITEDVFITCKSIMGGIDIRVPDGMEVVLDSKSILSGVSNTVPKYMSYEGPVIYIDFDGFMSGLSVRPSTQTSEKSEEDEDMFEEEEIKCE